MADTVPIDEPKPATIDDLRGSCKFLQMVINRLIDEVPIEKLRQVYREEMFTRVSDYLKWKRDQEAEKIS